MSTPAHDVITDLPKYITRADSLTLPILNFDPLSDITRSHPTRDATKAEHLTDVRKSMPEEVYVAGSPYDEVIEELERSVDNEIAFG